MHLKDIPAPYQLVAGAFCFLFPSSRAKNKLVPHVVQRGAPVARRASFGIVWDAVSMIQVHVSLHTIEKTQRLLLAPHGLQNVDMHEQPLWTKFAGDRAEF